MDFLYGVATEGLKRLVDVANEEICLAWGMKDDLKKLEQTMSTIKAVLLDAEKKQDQNEQLGVWLGQLKDVFLDAEDVLGELECERLRREVVKTRGSIGRKVRRFLSWSNPLAFRFSIGRKIKGIRQKLDHADKDRSTLHLREHQDERRITEGRREMTHSFVMPSEIIGRDIDKEEIINKLMKMENNDPISVIPVVGIGGLGKTALAKLVYNDDRVTEAFDLKMWVCVQQDLNVVELTAEILKSANSATNSTNHGNFSIDQALIRTKNTSNLSMEQLQMFLRSTLKDKKFLLVLDDVWNEDHSKWKEVRDLLSTCLKGSKIIVTTRSSKVATVLGTTQAQNLKHLSAKESRCLFFKCAIGDEQPGEQSPKLAIGRKIVKKCNGVPLALKTLGSLLYSKTDEGKWIYVRDNEIWELEREHNDPILSALSLSYTTMPQNLKQCLAYCSLVPQNVRGVSLDMIVIWMALGIIQQHNDNTEMEEIGKSYFNELCSRSFFQYLDDAAKNFNFYQGFEMHDLIHDLATSIIQHEYFMAKSSVKTEPHQNVRHLMIFLKDFHGQNIGTMLQKLKKSEKCFSQL